MKRVLIMILLLGLCACNEPNDIPDSGNNESQQPEQTEPEKEYYEIGDTYSKDGVRGLVFYITDDGRHGKIASMDKSATTVVWSTENVATSALDEEDGRNNMAVIRSIEGWREKYPPFAWCADQGEGWYLPAKNELIMMDRSGVIVAYATEYWSSTEQSENRAWYVSNYTGAIGTYTKGAKNRVRAIYEF